MYKFCEKFVEKFSFFSIIRVCDLAVQKGLEAAADDDEEKGGDDQKGGRARVCHGSKTFINPLVPAAPNWRISAFEKR